MKYYSYNSGQFMFDFIITCFCKIFKMAIKAIVYSPMLLTGYFITMGVFAPKGIIAIGVPTLFFAGISYLFVMILKNWMQLLRGRKNRYWLVLFGLCVSYTILFPVYLFYGPIKSFSEWMAPDYSTIFTVIGCTSLAFYIYLRYKFLSTDSN